MTSAGTPPLRDAPRTADHVARGHDRLVAANPGHHTHLRRSARRLRLPGGSGAGLRLLDPGLGRVTGAPTAARPRTAARVRRAGFDQVRTAPLPGRRTGSAHTVAGRATGGSAPARRSGRGAAG
jgi:hypothetical protein